MGLEQGLNGIYAITIQKNQSMAKLTGYGIGGRAKYFVTVYSAKALLEVIEQCEQNNCKYKLIGNGTNLLFSDKGYDGVVISLKGLNSITQENGIVSATAGVRLCDLVLFSAEFGLYGGETLVGIPATVGGATVMNAGAYGSCISDYIKTVTTINNGKLCKYDKNQCDFCYRHSRFLGKKEPIISVDFCFNQNKEKVQFHKNL
jgi:UDP-N-acetylmuramate dehydrogenase